MATILENKYWDAITVMFELGPHSPGSILKDTMSVAEPLNID